MAYFATLRIELDIRDSEGKQSVGFPMKTFTWSPVSATGSSNANYPPQRIDYRLAANTGTTLTLPTSTKIVVILPGAFTALEILASSGGATVVRFTPSSNPLPLPIVIPVDQATTASIFLKNADASNAQSLSVFYG